jgi:hypothetical protein
MEENKREEIKQEAKKILDNFSKALEKVKVSAKEIKKGLGGFRAEGKGKKADADFRKRMFENAPAKDGDFIIAEKKKW